MDYLQYMMNVPFTKEISDNVLNLIINGLPSIHFGDKIPMQVWKSFKPYYKWITFNT